jgi:hypothetical protein
MIAADVYERLARHLDDLPAGFARTKSGVELRILRRLFTPEEADLTLHLTLIAEEARIVALRAGMPVEETARRLDAMARKGLIFPVCTPGLPHTTCWLTYRATGITTYLQDGGTIEHAQSISLDETERILL